MTNTENPDVSTRDLTPLQRQERNRDLTWAFLIGLVVGAVLGAFTVLLDQVPNWNRQAHERLVMQKQLENCRKSCERGNQ